MRNDLLETDDDADSSRYYVIHADGTAQFTPEGAAYYQPYYQQMAIDIQTITTARRLITANRIIRPLIWEQMENDLLKKPATLEKRWLLSLMRCDLVEFERLGHLLEKRKACQLRLVP